MERDLKQATSKRSLAKVPRLEGLSADLATAAASPLPEAPPFPVAPFIDYTQPNVKVQGPGFEGVLLGRREDRTSGHIFYRVQDDQGVVHEAFEDELEPAGRQRNEIFPGANGITTFEGQYPFTLKLSERYLYASGRQPYLVVEEGADHRVVVKAAQFTYEGALQYYKPSRWIIHPEGAKPMEHRRDAPLIMILDNQGNPDHEEDPARRLPGVPRREVKVKTLAEASVKAREYVSDFNLGGGNCGPFIVSHKGYAVASISYNGRVWDPSGSHTISDEDLELPTESFLEQRQPLDEEWLGDLIRKKRLGGWVASFDHPQCLKVLAEVVGLADRAWGTEGEGAYQSQEEIAQRLDVAAMAELKQWAAGWSRFWTQGGRTMSPETTGAELAKIYKIGWTGLVHSELLQVQKETALALAINMLLESPTPLDELRLLESLGEWGVEARPHSLRLASAMNRAELKLLDKAEDPDDALVAEVGGAIFSVKDPDAAWDLFEMWSAGEFRPAWERLVPQPNPRG